MDERVGKCGGERKIMNDKGKRKTRRMKERE